MVHQMTALNAWRVRIASHELMHGFKPKALPVTREELTVLKVEALGSGLTIYPTPGGTLGHKCLGVELVEVQL